MQPSLFTPVWHNPDFLVNKSPMTGTKWKEKGITHLLHIFENKTLLTFQQLMQKYGIDKGQYLQYTQLKHTIKTEINISNTNLEQPPLLNSINKTFNSNFCLPLIPPYLSQ